MSACAALLRDALQAYSSAYPCPGFELEPGLTSGCDGSSDDCPTCAVTKTVRETSE